MLHGKKRLQHSHKTPQKSNKNKSSKRKDMVQPRKMLHCHKKIRPKHTSPTKKSKNKTNKPIIRIPHTLLPSNMLQRSKQKQTNTKTLQRNNKIRPTNKKHRTTRRKTIKKKSKFSLIVS